MSIIEYDALIIWGMYVQRYLTFVFQCLVQMGFFAQAGPLDIFVSNHLIPDEYEFDSTNEPSYRTSGEDSDTILAGSIVRLRIVGTRVDAQEIVRDIVLVKGKKMHDDWMVKYLFWLFPSDEEFDCCNAVLRGLNHRFTFHL